MAEFIKGLDLSEQFFFEVAKPILDLSFPSLEYSAGLIGYGSDVLGYDDPVSTDHMWGPRFYLFLDAKDIDLKPQIERVFAQNLPYTYRGFSVNFSEPDPRDGGTRLAAMIDDGEVSPLIDIHTLDGYLQDYLGTSRLDELDEADWLSLSEHKLLGLTSGRIFSDRLGITRKLDAIKFYPDIVVLYLLASQWSLIAVEQAFMKRTGQRQDELGSRIISARIVERLMRLCFLYSKRYAPYSKWFGTAFRQLPVDGHIKDELTRSLTAQELPERETHLVNSQVLVAHLHNQTGLTNPVEAAVGQFFHRDIKVIHADRIAQVIADHLKGTRLENIPFIGTLSQVANFTAIFDCPEYRRQNKALYQQSE